ncbi:MAG: dephospho-CoA kinase [Thermodesulfovibrio sp.]|nr:dephospho-CoA kinase [Thermodesulfovibrio sp.]
MTVLAGLTGNFGMGKSSVLGFFEGLGAVTISSDSIVSRLLEDSTVIERIRKMFGDEVVSDDGRLNKKTVASKVFSDPEQRKKLEDLLHPLVFAEIDAAAGNPGYAGRVIIVEVPLLFESSADCRFQKTITVHTSEEEAIRRLSQKGFCRAEALARLKVQMPISEKIRRADYVIDNSGSTEETQKQVEAVYTQLVSLSRTF